MKEPSSKKKKEDTRNTIKKKVISNVKRCQMVSRLLLGWSNHLPRAILSHNTIGTYSCWREEKIIRGDQQHGKCPSRRWMGPWKTHLSLSLSLSVFIFVDDKQKSKLLVCFELHIKCDATLKDRSYCLCQLCWHIFQCVWLIQLSHEGEMMKDIVLKALLLMMTVMMKPLILEYCWEWFIL